MKALLLILTLLGVSLCVSKSSLPSMMLNNWKDTIVTWTNTKENKNLVGDNPVHPLGLSSLRISNDWTTSALSQDSIALKVGNQYYLDASKWGANCLLDVDTNAWNCEYTQYDGTDLDFSLKTSTYIPIGEPQVITTVDVVDDNYRDIQVLSYYVSDNPNPDHHLWGWLNGDIFMVDLTKPGQFYFATASWDSPDAYQIGQPGTSSDPLTQFGQGYLAGNTVVDQASVAIGLQFNSRYPGRLSTAWFRALRTDYDTVLDAAEDTLAEDPDFWFSQHAQDSKDWLSQAVKPDLSDWEDGSVFYDVSLLFCKHSQNPTLGTFTASFHPAYEFKVWARDALFSAMIMDAAGYHDESAAFYRWIASADLNAGAQGGGYFHTTYDFWSGDIIWFVEPQLDPTGLFPLALRYRTKVGGSDLTNERPIASRLQDIRTYFLNNQGQWGLAPADYSIWEESSSPNTGEPLPVGYFAFSQSMAWAGMTALGNMLSDQTALDRAADIRSAVQTRLWVDSRQGYARQVWSDSLTQDTRFDAASSSLLWTGLLEDSSRAASHLSGLESTLARDTQGLARYEGDIYFYASVFNPGGCETTQDMPPWPVITLFTSWVEDYDRRQERLEWSVSRAAYGGMPVGEAVDPVIDEFVWSSASDVYEHAGITVWTLLIHHGLVPIPTPE
eukprot:gnl/Dysnectes_brevis/3711_a4753_803.p1 GENE.gnl/Dysnectes_brevis/3711_a4753_803~~gnl/Dysnectes_brevis/3711_a4753_803.p1  ORF type:complete len:669 (+),score=229.95 gnl/Dysnectes_brevis/3711_a4753_803:551-2557(+)